MDCREEELPFEGPADPLNLRLRRRAGDEGLRGLQDPGQHHCGPARLQEFQECTQQRVHASQWHDAGFQ